MTSSNTGSFATFLRNTADRVIADATRTTGTTDPDVARLVQDYRDAQGRPRVSPFDPAAPVGTQRRRIKAHNALLDVARLGVDRICGHEEEPDSTVGPGNRRMPTAGPCVLKAGHSSPFYDDTYRYHMDAAQAARAERYLTHSEPDPARRA